MCKHESAWFRQPSGERQANVPRLQTTESALVGAPGVRADQSGGELLSDLLDAPELTRSAVPFEFGFHLCPSLRQVPMIPFMRSSPDSLPAGINQQGATPEGGCWAWATPWATTTLAVPQNVRFGGGSLPTPPP